MGRRSLITSSYILKFFIFKCPSWLHVLHKLVQRAARVSRVGRSGLVGMPPRQGPVYFRPTRRRYTFRLRYSHARDVSAARRVHPAQRAPAQGGSARHCSRVLSPAHSRSIDFAYFLRFAPFITIINRCSVSRTTRARQKAHRLHCSDCRTRTRAPRVETLQIAFITVCLTQLDAMLQTRSSGRSAQHV